VVDSDSVVFRVTLGFRVTRESTNPQQEHFFVNIQKDAIFRHQVQSLPFLEGYLPHLEGSQNNWESHWARTDMWNEWLDGAWSNGVS
jgi:hypothetical protein